MSIDVAWAAGLFEGEGSITSYKLPNRRDSIKTQLGMSLTDRDVLENFARSVNCGKVLGPYKGQREGNKERYNWYVQNQRDCLYVLGQLYPYLGIRRKEKANEMIALILERYNGRLDYRLHH